MAEQLEGLQGRFAHAGRGFVGCPAEDDRKVGPTMASLLMLGAHGGRRGHSASRALGTDQATLGAGQVERCCSAVGLVGDIAMDDVLPIVGAGRRILE